MIQMTPHKELLITIARNVQENCRHGVSGLKVSLDVEVPGGVVLEGTAPSYTVKKYAQDGALNTDGVKQVNNRIAVVAPSPFPNDWEVPV